MYTELYTHIVYSLKILICIYIYIIIFYNIYKYIIFFLNIYINVFVFIYIHNKYTQYTHKLCKKTFILDAINHD